MTWEGEKDDNKVYCYYACVNPICPPSPPFTIFDDKKDKDDENCHY